MAKTRKLSGGLKAWSTHWKKVRAEMTKKGTFKKGDNLTKVFEEAKKTYKKKGGEDPAPAEPAPMMEEKEEVKTAGRRTRKHRGRK